MYYIERRQGALMRKRFMHIRHFLHFWFFLYFFVYFFIPMSFTRLSSLFSYSLSLVSQHTSIPPPSLSCTYTQNRITFSLWKCFPISFHSTFESLLFIHSLIIIICNVKSSLLSCLTETRILFVLSYITWYVRWCSCVGPTRTQVHQKCVSGKT